MAKMFAFSPAHRLSGTSNARYLDFFSGVTTQHVHFVLDMTILLLKVLGNILGKNFRCKKLLAFLRRLPCEQDVQSSIQFCKMTGRGMRIVSGEMQKITFHKSCREVVAKMDDFPRNHCPRHKGPRLTEL